MPRGSRGEAGEDIADDCAHLRIGVGGGDHRVRRRLRLLNLSFRFAEKLLAMPRSLARQPSRPLRFRRWR